MALICKFAVHMRFSSNMLSSNALTVIEVPTLLALRRDPRLLKLPPYLSAFCILVGVAWLCLLPLNQYSRHTYISENALLPGQVHTYFGGSEQNIFNAYKYEIKELAGKEQGEWVTHTILIHKDRALTNGVLGSQTSSARYSSLLV